MARNKYNLTLTKFEQLYMPIMTTKGKVVFAQSLTANAEKFYNQNEYEIRDNIFKKKKMWR